LGFAGVTDSLLIREIVDQVRL